MEVEIKKFDHLGRGLGKINNKVVFVPKCVPWEIVDIDITENKKNYCVGKIKKIIKESPERENQNLCPFFDKCGGCDFINFNYNLEKDFKKNKTIELLGECDSFYETKKLYYRNKITLHIKDNKIGYYQNKTDKIVPINHCYLVSEKINKVLKDLQEFSYNYEQGTRIIIKENLGRLLMNLDFVVNNLFLEHFNYIDTIICNNKIIKGKGYLEEEIFNKTFKITSEAFFQVNKEGLENIYLVIKRFLEQKKIKTMLDLYSGTGLWGILFSNDIENITSIEVNKEACENAKNNLLNNHISNIKIINGKVEDYIDSFQDIDLVITDPPRSGLDNKTVDYLKVIKSKYLIYVSCDMQTLKRDLERLKENYHILEINTIDMFRGTYHCEVVTILERKAENMI